jgi:hypothetical protein
LAVGLGLALLGAACGTGSISEAAPTVTVPQVEGSPREDVPSALDWPDSPQLPVPLVPVDEIISGGPPPDGIPPIDEPRFLAAGDVDFLQDNEPVLAFEVGGEHRAYPVQILIWHEIVNDTVGGVPVSVTYCPLCNTAVAFERSLGERTFTFGTSGRLFQSALVMYDRQTESLWSHFNGRAIAGHLTGTELEQPPVATVAWSTWRDANPDALVLSRETGHDRSYGRNPYPGYDDVNSAPFLFDGEIDGRLPAKTRVVGFGLDSEPTAVQLGPLLDVGVVSTELDGQPVAVLASPGTASALDAGSVAGGRDVGATGVFLATVEGRRLGFERDGDGFVDDVTGSRWNIFGQALEGPLAGTRLTAIEHVDTFWFAWAAFAPETRVLPPV